VFVFCFGSELQSAPKPSKAADVPGNQDKDLKVIPRSPDHKKAYSDRPERGEHINIKVTPPQMKRNGKAGKILVEVYNYSNYHISAMRFEIELVTPKGWDRFEAQVEVDELGPQWSDAYWIDIPGNGKISDVSELTVKRLEIFGAGAKSIKLPLYTELINK
jgi:hypothetical protein